MHGNEEKAPNPAIRGTEIEAGKVRPFDDIRPGV